MWPFKRKKQGFPALRGAPANGDPSQISSLGILYSVGAITHSNDASPAPNGGADCSTSSSFDAGGGGCDGGSSY